MNCYQQIETLKKYAENIALEYGHLNILDNQNKKFSEEYEIHFQNLKKWIECERLYCALLTEQQLDAIHTILYSREEVPPCLTLLDIFSIEDDSEVLEWDRIYKNVAWNKLKKDNPVLDSDTKQIHMIPLIPYDEETNYTYYLSKTKLFEGQFNIEFSNQLLNSKTYPKNMKNYFLYSSAYCNRYVENYYLKTKFSFEMDKMQSAQQIIIERYKGDISRYKNYCLDTYKEDFSMYMKEAIHFENEEITEITYFWIAIVRDAFYAYLKAAPYMASLKVFQDFIKAEGNGHIKNYFSKKLDSVINEKYEEVKEKIYRK